MEFLFEEQPDNSYHLSQPSYMEKVNEIPISSSRRKEHQSEPISREQTQPALVVERNTKVNRSAVNKHNLEQHWDH